MSFLGLCAQTATILENIETGRRQSNAPIYTLSEVSSTPIRLMELPTTESRAPSETLVEHYAAFTPPTTPTLTERHTLRISATDYKILSVLKVSEGFSSDSHHLELVLERIVP